MWYKKTDNKEEVEATEVSLSSNILNHIGGQQVSCELITLKMIHIENLNLDLWIFRKEFVVEVELFGVTNFQK